MAIKAMLLPFISHAARIYKKFGRRLRINVHWLGRLGAEHSQHLSEAIVSDVTIQHLMELVFDSEPEPESEVVEASSFLCLHPDLPDLIPGE